MKLFRDIVIFFSSCGLVALVGAVVYLEIKKLFLSPLIENLIIIGAEMIVIIIGFIAIDFFLRKSHILIKSTNNSR